MTYILITTLLSLGIIVLIHQIYLYLTNTFTTPIVKNMVDYEKKHTQYLSEIQQIGLSCTPIDNLPIIHDDEPDKNRFDMINELSDYVSQTNDDDTVAKQLQTYVLNDIDE
jgi:hypothetical protein